MWGQRDGSQDESWMRGEQDPQAVPVPVPPGLRWQKGSLSVTLSRRPQATTTPIPGKAQQAEQMKG